MKKEQLKFIDGVALTGDGTRLGVSFDDKTKWARDDVQAEMVRKVMRTPQDPETFATELAKEQNLPSGSMEATLRILHFVLDYKDFLQLRQYS